MKHTLPTLQRYFWDYHTNDSYQTDMDKNDFQLSFVYIDVIKKRDQAIAQRLRDIQFLADNDIEMLDLIEELEKFGTTT